MVYKCTPAAVLNIIDHGESDKIVTFYSPSAGKLVGIAKGAKRSKKRFVNKLELFSLLELTYDDKSWGSLVRIAEAELLDSFISLRMDYNKYVAAVLINELMLCWTQENDADSNLFSLLIWAYKCLNGGENILQTITLCQIKLTSIMGYQPHLAGCMECGIFDPSGNPFGFSVSRGGLVCRRCKGEGTGQMPISLSTAKLWASAQEMPLEKLRRLRFSEASQQEALALLKRYSQRLLQRDVHSWNFLEGFR